MKKQAALIIALMTLCSFSANARDITQADVERHLQAMADLYNKEKIDPAEIFKFMKAYATPEGLYKNSFYINGATEPTIHSATGEQIIRNTAKFKGEYIRASARYELIEYTLNPDQKSADVKYKLWHAATFEDMGDGKQWHKSFDSMAECVETFTLAGEQVKGLKNDCTIQIKADKPVEVKGTTP